MGDIHAAQGDGEVAGTAIETEATVELRIELQKGRSNQGPGFITPVTCRLPGHWFGTKGYNANLKEASRDAPRGMGPYLGEKHGLDKPRALVLASACVGLRISQIVNAGVFTVSAFLPLSIFDQ